MFEGFERRDIATPGGSIHARIGGSGPPLLLLHGYPQTHVMWHAVVPELSKNHTVVCADLPGYGDSSKPPSTDDHAAYSKRGMAATLLHAMRALGFESFDLAGHDRGARVAYRMALDHPKRVERLATLDIVPTYSQWESLGWRGSMGSYHWYFLAQPAPLPEKLIAADPVFYLRNTLARWAAPDFEFDAEAMREYERAFSNPETVRACCEDYRAGATIDYELDAGDFGTKKIACPMLALWGQRPGRPARDMLATWRDWATDVRGGPVESGHFLAEEAPSETERQLGEFFG
ncbi:MAG: alpha/beta fold hydrolase [Dehalococcoidia bacterium]